jgi:hypothetical protein
VILRFTQRAAGRPASPRRYPRRAPVVLFLVLLVSQALAAPRAPKPGIVGLGARMDAERALVSFRVDNALTPEAVERIQSGIQVTFKHRIDVVAPRSFPIPDKTIARTVIRTRTDYDSLTGRYTLIRSIEFKTRNKGAIEPREDRRSTESVEEMRRWMTEFDEIDVYDPARPFSLFSGRDLRVRVRSELGRRYLLLIFPSTIDVNADCSLEP